MKYIVLLAVLVSVGCASKKTQTDADSGKSAAVTAPAAAPEAIKATPAASAPAKLTCTKNKDVRVLEVVNNGKGCAFNYTKSEKMKVAASSNNGAQHCEHAEAKVRTKLEKAGYQCI